MRPIVDSTDDSVDKELAQCPVRRSIARSISGNVHCKCFLLGAFIHGCLLYMYACRHSYLGGRSLEETARREDMYDLPVSESHISRSGMCSKGYNFIPAAFAVMLYVVYLMECWHSKTRADLASTGKDGDVTALVDEMRLAEPAVWWRAVCYHYIRRTRQVTRYRNGEAVTSTQVYYERVNSHTAASVFLYGECGVKDISKQLVGLAAHPLVKVRLSKGFVFANLQAANEFEEQRTRFFQENEIRDDYMEVREGMDLGDAFKESLVVFSPSKPWYCRLPVFYLCSLLLLSWPLRMLIECRTSYVHYQVTKLFGTNYLTPTSANYTGGLTRTSTIESAELEAGAASYVVVPSYSTAMLMDAAHDVVIAGDAATITRRLAPPPPLLPTPPPRSFSMNQLFERMRPGRSSSMNAMGVLEESPPPYEMAIRMCTPLYRRLRGQRPTVKPAADDSRQTPSRLEEAHTLLQQSDSTHM